MRFEEKSALTMTLVVVTVYAAYSTVVLGAIARSPDRQVAFPAWMIGAATVPAVLAVGAHVVLALTFRSQASARRDHQDALIKLRSQRSNGYVLAVGMFSGIVLAMLNVPGFGIAQVLLAAWVLAEVSGGITRVALYRRLGPRTVGPRSEPTHRPGPSIPRHGGRTNEESPPAWWPGGPLLCPRGDTLHTHTAASGGGISLQ